MTECWQITIVDLVYYRPQRSCGKVMFSQVSVILFTGGLWQTPPWVDTPTPGLTPLGRPPPRQTPPLRWLLQHPTGMHSCLLMLYVWIFMDNYSGELFFPKTFHDVPGLQQKKTRVIF